MGRLRLHRLRGGTGRPGQPLTFDFEGARRATAGTVLNTPLVACPDLAHRVGRPVLLKLESLQRTGSFKVRGALARVAALSPEERRNGVVACSSGNHGTAVAWAAARADVAASVYVPDWVDPVKLEGIRATGAEAVLAGATFDEAEARAVADARATGRVFVSAYDDPWVIAGQGTLGLELSEALGMAPAAVLVPLSGGGLAGGIAAALQMRLGADAPPVVGVSAERAAVMLASLAAGHPVTVDEEETLASALAGGIGEENRWSFALVRDAVADHLVVTEHEIATAITFAYNELRIVVEGGGAVGLAALLAGRFTSDAPPDAPVVVLVSGGNIARDTLVGLLSDRAPT